MEEKPNNLKINFSEEESLKDKITPPTNEQNSQFEKGTKEEYKEKLTLKELDKIDLKLITIETVLNEFYAKTNIIQYYKNYADKPIELILKYPYNPGVQFSKFTLEMGNKKVISKVIEREKAEEKYTDAIAKGNTGVISKIEDEYYEVNIGNISAGELVKLTSEFIQFLKYEDMNYCYTSIKNFPYFSNNVFNGKKNMYKIKAKINIKAHSKINRIITNGFRQNLEKKFNNDNTQCELNYYTLNFTNQERSENEFKILFSTESMNALNLITQYDPKNDETSCIIKMTYNKKGINPALFIFLIDQSGSMSGERLNIAIEALILFLKSLPKNSYYQLIGFSTGFNYIYSKDPCEYTIENVTKTISELKDIDAYGGTNLLKPLEIIFKSKKYDKINLSRNLFILTDGEVQNSKYCLQLISKYTHIYKVHTFGIGDEYNKSFIETAGQNGSFNFVDDISSLKLKVINALNKALRSYLYEPKIKVENINQLYEFFPKQKFYYQEDVFKYYFIAKNKIEDRININLEYYDKNELIKKDFIIDEKNIIKEEDGNIISKIIIGNILNNYSLEINKEIELAKKYQVLSKDTSLYAEVENENSNPYLSHLEVVEQIDLDYTVPQKNEDKEKEEEEEEEKKKSSNDNGSESNEEDKIKCRVKRMKKKCKKKGDDSKDSSSSSSSSDSEPEEKCTKKKE